MPALDRFSEVARRWFDATFPAPTAAQEEGWAAISEGSHALVLAPTGSGKTLAAFLWALDRLVTSAPVDEARRLRVLYVSPLKALTYDVERNLRAPLAGMALEAQRMGVDVPDIRVATRTGDTPASERRDLARHPPDILITTPESLYLLLTSSSRVALQSVEHVIVDEIHSVAATKRGSHLAVSLERLERLVTAAGGAAPQRIGLSATQRPLDEIARFLGGRARVADVWRPRPVTIVDTGVRKALDLEVIVPIEDMASPAASVPDPSAAPTAATSIWPHIYPRLLELVHAHHSTLIFVNSRRLAERLAARLNELEAEQHGLDAGASYSGAAVAGQAGAARVPAGAELVRAHHGSISREQRLEIEDLLKAGKLPALVATSSLELGIDMGAIDLVVQVEAPTSVASGLQRIGRAGHSVGVPSVGKVFPKYRHDLLVAAVTCTRMRDGLIEETRVPRNPVDVLAQQLVAMVAMEDLTVDEVFDVAAGAYPFADLTRPVLEGVLDMLSGRYPSDEFAELRPRITWDRLTGALSARAGARMLAVTSGGTIPDRGLFGVFTPEGHRVGELDEECVYESRAGETIILGASTWRIEDITRDRVVVTPAPGEPGKMPFWHGDRVGRPYELGAAVGAFTAAVAAGEWDVARLHAECGLDELAAGNLVAYVTEERESTGGIVPTDRQIVVERFRDELGDWRLCVLSPFGARVHAPWALAIEQKVRDRLGLEVQTIWSDDGIVVRLPEADDLPPVDAVVLEPEEIEDLVVSQVASSALFAARFRENAARALLLPRRRPGQRTPLWQLRQKAADLLAVASRYGSFPILLETYRECLRDVFDIPALTALMEAVRARRVRVVGVDTTSPSPFASSLAFSYVANFMYEGDAPLAERRAQALTLDRDMLAELLGADELRELIDPTALASLESWLQYLDEPRWARSVDAAHDLLLRLGDLTPAELAARSAGAFEDTLVAARRALRVRISGEERLIAAEDAGRYRDALGVSPPPGVPEAFLAPVADALVSVMRRWARSHGPFLTAEAARRFGLDLVQAAAVLERLEADGTIVLGEFRPDGSEREWCDSEVLRQLRQRSLAALRREVEPTEQVALARFLPAWHGVGSDAAGADRLYEVIEQLQGLALPASVLERDVLSARVRGYTPRLLDELCAAGEVLWVGAGPLGRDDGRVVLLLPDSAPLLAPPLGERPTGAEHDRIRSALEARGACFFRELAGSDDAASLDALWDLVWAGEVTNDSYAAVRAFTGGTTSKPSRWRGGRPRPGRLTVLGPPRAQGRWSLTSREMGSAPADPTLAAYARASALLERHGVLTREAVRGEGAAGGFAGVYPVLRGMEEAGRVRRGYFVAGLGGAQFALPGAVDRLRGFREAGAPVLVLAATDPANAYGLSLPWPVKGVARAAGAYVVLVDGLASLYLERGAKSVTALRAFDGEWEEAAVGGLTTLVRGGRLSRLAVQKFPPELGAALQDAGFVPTPRGLTLYAS
ncbi:MAG TPA: DEAD/DEAH box helicase [Acidimicrobiales bacterium]|nr:DEAD/DEAH box helicase [Acidimicrobiales bacterium]